MAWPKAVFRASRRISHQKDLIVKNASTLEIREEAYKEGYKPMLIEGINKVLKGITTLEELNSKLLFY